MQFRVNLIRVSSITPEQSSVLESNCTHIVGEHWFMEGDVDYLTEHDIEFELLDDCILVDSLAEGELTKEDLMNLAGLLDDE
ncbi:hypothetical protein L4174_023910 (plasmid) [Photobacterium sp. CCB-ST2H9]|uniref:hypothetical protein n=1 Tax=Photobacterium sp. CCB-ST2H9 TaxID=2912855 RepID=UPI00200370ED|nr:hypothetical protein [Photobacterium sp. CCB-ST2H9]UTM60433.1 hypothetical protein L4174_023910 [Photobacterium sp. CCB-ST2H9]